MKTDTPETDALLETDWHHVDDDITDTPAYNRMTGLCRKLECERDEARNGWRDEIQKGQAELRKAEVIYDKTRIERDEAGKTAENIRDSLCRPEWAKPIIFPWEVNTHAPPTQHASNPSNPPASDADA